MKLKTTINKQDYFDKLIKIKCKFRKVCGLYPAKCKNVKYVGQIKNFTEIDVYQVNDKEAELLKKVFLLFKNSTIRIVKD